MIEEKMARIVKEAKIELIEYCKEEKMSLEEKSILNGFHLLAKDFSSQEKNKETEEELTYPFEPYKTKTVELITITSKEQRQKIIKESHYNMFLINSEDVMIDFLTDSGTGAMSDQQTACLLTGDESYAGSKSFLKFEKAIKDLTTFKFIYPVHQGRAAERILFSVICEKNKIVLSNGLFDTTRGNIEHLGGIGKDLPIEESSETQKIHPFKGNICVKKLEKELKENEGRVSAVILTITSNSGGGQPVSIDNIRKAKKLCTIYEVPLFIDGCRFAENAFFIKQREREFTKISINEIVRETFCYTDGMTMSAKKDGIAHIGGWIAVNNEKLAEQIEELLILTEGFKTYGGLAGRDMEAIVKGLAEATDEIYLKHRIESCAYFGQQLKQFGIPIVEPVGGHAIFIDAKKFVPHIEPLHFPAQALVVELYVQGGIRAAEVGSFMFGRQPDGTETPARHELLRLAFPRRVYNKNHFDYG